MAVLVEAISIVIKYTSLEKTYRGGVKAFATYFQQINNTFCSDSELVRVGFTEPGQVEGFIAKLTLFGLVHLRDGVCIDMAIADQRGGLLHPCDWASMGQAQLPSGPHAKVAACRLAGSKIVDLTVPEGWRFESSISSKVGAAPGPTPPKRNIPLAVLANRPGTLVPLAQRLGLRPAKK